MNNLLTLMAIIIVLDAAFGVLSERTGKWLWSLISRRKPDAETHGWRRLVYGFLGAGFWVGVVAAGIALQKLFRG